MARPKRESVYATFHYLVRHEKGQGDEIVKVGFTDEEFEELVRVLQRLPNLDLNDEDTLDRVRYRDVVPIENVDLIDDRTAFGLYRASYWGHSFDNTAVGKIPSNSVNLRQFYFCLYHSRSGRIYIGVQYLAQFGNYKGLKKNILRFIDQSDNVVAHSFRRDSVGVERVLAKEIKVNISRRAAALDRDGGFGQKAVVTFPAIRGDQEMQDQVNNRLVPVLGTDKGDVQRAVAQLLRDSELTDVNDEDIDGCTVIAEVNGQSKKIQFIGTGQYPSQYPLEVGFNDDGHPTRASAQQSMLRILEENILDVAEND